MPTGRLKRRLDGGAIALGSWIAFSDTYSVELMALTGFDFLVIDLEHCPIGLNKLRTMIPIIESTGTSTVIRVPDRGDYWIKQALDIGADSVMVPRVDSAELAKEAVRYAKYYPLGERGFGPVRASQFFARSADYLKNANENTLLFVQLEHRTVLENLEEILAVDGIDGYFIGPGDLSQSLGFLGQSQAQEVQEFMQEIIAKLNQHSKVWGTLNNDLEGFRHNVGMGGRVVSLGGDILYLKLNAEKFLTQMRQTIKELDGCH